MERHPKPISSTASFLPERARGGERTGPQNRFLPSSSVLGEQKQTAKPKLRTGLVPVVYRLPAHISGAVPEQEVWAKRKIDEVIAALLGNSPAKGKHSVHSPKKRKEKKRESAELAVGREKCRLIVGEPASKLEDLLSRWDLPKKYLLVRQNPLKHREEVQQKLISLSLKEERKSLCELTPDAHFGVRVLESVRKDEKISIKEAMRNREWLLKCKEVILREFQSHILRSFAVSLEPVAVGPSTAYRVYIATGNNSQLVKKLFAVRWWWNRVDESEKHTANLLWTQWKNKPWLETMETAREDLTHCARNSVSETVSDCPLRFNPYSGGNLQSESGRPVDVSPLSYELITKSQSYVCLDSPVSLCSSSLRTHNRLEGNQHLANKKALFLNMRKYYECIGRDPFEVIPLTFHIKDGEQDSEFQRFEEAYFQLVSQNDRTPDVSKRSKLVWILKPGENTNRGTGISLCSTIESVKEEMKSAMQSARPGVKRTFIIQKYMERPLLINKRKFDIRLYAMVMSVNGIMQVFFYREGYVRTSSKEFSLSNLSNKLIHLTNDAVQKHSEDYGKFEMANKLSYSELQRYLEAHTRVNFLAETVPKMRAIVKDTVQAVFPKLNPRRRLYSFEIFGYDFMLDERGSPWLLEVNTNPCLELSSPLLARIIPAMLDNALRIAVDPLFPEPSTRRSQDALAENKFELIFSEHVDGQILRDQLGTSFCQLQRDDLSLRDLDRTESDCSDGC